MLRKETERQLLALSCVVCRSGRQPIEHLGNLGGGCHSKKNTSKKLLAFSHLMLCAENTKHPSIPNFRERGGAVRWNWGELVRRHSFSVTYSTHVTRVVKDSELCLVTVHVAYKVWSTLTLGQVTTSLVENINV